MLGHVLFKVSQRSFNECRIELGTGASADLLRGLLELDRSIVGSLVDHRVDGIDNGKNAGSERNVASRNAARVATAVELFVTGMHEFSSIFQEFNSRQELITVSGML